MSRSVTLRSAASRAPTTHMPVLEAQTANGECHAATQTANLGSRLKCARARAHNTAVNCAYTYRDIAKMIDHSLLAPTMTVTDFEAGIALGLKYDVASVCIVPAYLGRCAELLTGSDVKPSTVIGFPHGGQATSAKVAETRIALADGGVELDMVINLQHTLSGNFRYVRDEIAAVCEVTHAHGQKLKVIFETCYLNEAQKLRLCEICAELGVDWVKTSTGFGTAGATLEDLRLMRAHLPANVQVKASGGVRELDFVLAAREIGVTRCGSSRTAEILDECQRRLA